MFVDASALTAMLTEEKDARELLARAQNYAVRFTSPLAVWETAIAVARALGMDVRNAASAVEDFLVLTEIEVRPMPAEVRGLALEAFDRFGKGRHPAGRGRLRLCLRRLCRGAVALQGRRFPADRH